VREASAPLLPVTGNPDGNSTRVLKRGGARTGMESENSGYEGPILPLKEKDGGPSALPLDRPKQWESRVVHPDRFRLERKRERDVTRTKKGGPLRKRLYSLSLWM